MDEGETTNNNTKNIDWDGGNGVYNGTSPDANPPPEKREGALGSSKNIIFLLVIVTTAIILLPLIFLGYSRLRKETLLEQENRKRIYDHIMKNPGEHFRGISRALQIEIGVLCHHLNILEREQLIVSEQDGEKRRFYPAGMKSDGKIRLSRIQENILKEV